MANMPKRVKHRKVFKGRIKRFATRGNRVSYGDFGLQALEAARIPANVIEAARITANRALACRLSSTGFVWALVTHVNRRHTIPVDRRPVRFNRRMVSSLPVALCVRAIWLKWVEFATNTRAVSAKIRTTILRLRRRYIQLGTNNTFHSRAGVLKPLTPPICSPPNDSGGKTSVRLGRDHV